MEQALNLRLYRLLKKHFNRVRVYHRSEAAEVTVRRNRAYRLREEARAVYPGEYYAVDCPYCGDTRQRLYINHMFGQVDDEGHGFWHMAHCFNENCLATSGRVAELIEDLTETAIGLSRFRVSPGRKVDLDELRCAWPGEVTRVDRLPDDHHAVRYLADRKFDPERIGRFYNVHFCAGGAGYWVANNRLVIPLYRNGRMVGWQARLIGDAKKGGPPKYWTCPGTPKREIVYNLANAVRYRTGVIMEGPTDVWSLGPMGVCCLGSGMSEEQQRSFLEGFRDYSAILLFDPEECGKAGTRRLAHRFGTAFKRGFALVELPEGTDPGSLDRRFLREYVADSAREQGVEVSWRLR